MTIEDAIEYLLDDCEDCPENKDGECMTHSHCFEVKHMAIRSLEMQKKLAEFSGMDICDWVEDYDYDEENTSEYEFEASVDDFLINESKAESKEKR